MRPKPLSLAVAFGGGHAAAWRRSAPTGSPARGSSRARRGGSGPGTGTRRRRSDSPIRSTSRSTMAGRSLFDGQTLKGWSGDQNWKVEDGAITIESTCEKPTGTVYLVWQGGEAADFELKMRDERAPEISMVACSIAVGLRRSAAAATGRQAVSRGTGWTGRWRCRRRPRPARVRARVASRTAARRPIRRAKKSGTCGGAQYRLRRRQPLHRPVLRAVHGPRHRRVEGAGRCGPSRARIHACWRRSASRPSSIAVLQAERLERAAHHRDRQSL